jgi:hypothetical protein
MGNRIRYYSSFFMVALYVAIGLLFLCTDIAIDTFPMYRTGVGITMIVYAAVRAYLTIRRERNLRDHE